ncbi:hypothetical protein MXL26_11015 [Acinetobacter towneri]|uniref:hypothetical protein n=1 Tax=Acinetobacter towneri TaxID=202956 RepID=UPI002DB69402|nr:hypothetical protein [Acinetobacter towneri]MEB6565868.1 hypothetical protein [Acinetobacter towneri]
MRKAKGALVQGLACGKEFMGHKYYCTVEFNFNGSQVYKRNYEYMTNSSSSRIELQIESINRAENIEKLFISKKSNVLVEVEFEKLGSFIYAVKSGYINQLFNLDKKRV